MVTYNTIFRIPAMSSICSAVVMAMTMKHCNAVLVKQLALDKKQDGYNSQMSGTEITASARKAEGGEEENEEGRRRIQ